MVEELFNLLIKKVISEKRDKEPFFVLLNDIDHYSARDHFPKLLEKLKENGFHGNCNKNHFKKRDKNYGDNSEQYPSMENKFDIPDEIFHKFDCAKSCSSAQMILEVR